MWPPNLWRLGEGTIGAPDQIRAVAGLDLGRVHPVLPHRILTIINIANLARLVGIDIVDARQGLETHGVQPFRLGFSLVQAIILQGLSRLAHSGVAEGVNAVGRAHHRPVLRPEERLVDEHMHRPKEAHLERGVADGEVPPRAIQEVLVFVVGIDGQTIDVDQLRLVDRIGPAQIGIMAVQHKGRAGEKAACDMQAFA